MTMTPTPLTTSPDLHARSGTSVRTSDAFSGDPFGDDPFGDNPFGNNLFSGAVAPAPALGRDAEISAGTADPVPNPAVQTPAVQTPAVPAPASEARAALLSTAAGFGVATLERTEPVAIPVMMPVPLAPSIPGIQDRGHRWKVAGPPGTGKTTWVQRTSAALLKEGMWINDEHFQLPPSQITLVSFTKPAAETIRQRLAEHDIEIDERNVATLHGMCYRIINEQRQGEGLEWIRMARERGPVRDWNDRYPHWRLTVQDADSDVKASPADQMLEMASYLRGSLIPDEQWAEALNVQIERMKAEESRNIPELSAVIAIDRAWQDFKEEQDLMDFTDLIIRGAELLPPGIMLMMVDEAQDFSPLEMKTLLAWDECIARTVYIGDDDQAIYQGLKGARPESFIDLQADEGCEIVLAQSYRIPERVQQVAMRIISGVTQRWEKNYRARDEVGVVALSNATYRVPEELLPLLQENASRGQTTMIIGYAKKMLEPTLEMLREHGLPYHNPFAHNGRWNPLPVARKGAASTRDRILAWQKAERNGEDWRLALERLIDVALRGKKAELMGMLMNHPAEIIAPELLTAYLKPETLEAALTGDLDFYWDHLQAELKKEKVSKTDTDARGSNPFKYAINLARMGNLEQEPMIIIGTIHSSKGTEADHVVLFPDFPEAKVDPDELLRVMYVGVTRAKRGLVLCQRSNSDGLPVRALLGLN